MMNDSIEIQGIWLRTREGCVEVLIEVDGEWRLVNREKLGDGEKTIISHITEPRGMRKARKDLVTA